MVAFTEPLLNSTFLDDNNIYSNDVASMSVFLDGSVTVC